MYSTSCNMCFLERAGMQLTIWLWYLAFGDDLVVIWHCRSKHCHTRNVWLSWNWWFWYWTWLTNWQWVDIVHSILTERYSKRVAFFLATSRIKVYMMVSICKKLIPKMAHRSCFWFLRIIGNCPNTQTFQWVVGKWGMASWIFCLNMIKPWKIWGHSTSSKKLLWTSAHICSPSWGLGCWWDLRSSTRARNPGGAARPGRWYPGYPVFATGTYSIRKYTMYECMKPPKRTNIPNKYSWMFIVY